MFGRVYSDESDGWENGSGSDINDSETEDEIVEQPIKRRVMVDSAVSKPKVRVRKTYIADIASSLSGFAQNSTDLASFATGNSIESDIGIPSVHVKDFGRIAYPLNKYQCPDLMKYSTQAPFGKGVNTLVDTSVRKAWQIESELVTIQAMWMEHSLPKIVADCCTKLGVDASKVKANFYKLLWYEAGGHFKTHRDTEKESGMFGSVLIQLPAEHEGGALSVTHEGKTKRFECAKESGDKAYYTAFYADCEHELEPIESGYRLVLAFNLVKVGGSSSDTWKAPSSANYRSFEDILIDATKLWNADKNGIEKCVFPLSHQYTQANASFDNLKGVDQNLLKLLRGVIDPETKEPLFSVYLALVTKEENGTCEDDYDGGYYGGYGRYGRSNKVRHTMCPDGDITISYSTNNWVGPKGAVNLGDLVVDFETELLTYDPDNHDDQTVDEACAQIFGEEADEEEAEGYMGNYSGSLQLWYHSAVLVFWPMRKDFQLKLSQNPQQAVESLKELNKRSDEFKQKFTQVLEYLSRFQSTKWTVASVIGLAQTTEQVKIILTLCAKRGASLAENDLQWIAAVLKKHPFDEYAEEFRGLLKSLSLGMMMTLLNMMNNMLVSQKSSASAASGSASSSAGATPGGVWQDMVQLLVNELLTRSPTFVEVFMLKEVCCFICANCSDETQARVAKHLGACVGLTGTNRFMEMMDPKTASAMIRQFKQTVVDLFVRTNKPAGGDVISTLKWMIAGNHTEYLPMIHAQVQVCLNTAEVFRSVFAEDFVKDEMKKTNSPFAAVLRTAVERRIQSIAPLAVAPNFSWRIKGVQNTTHSDEVATFLANDVQTKTIVGFKSIIQARKFADIFSRSRSSELSKCVSAVESGSGANAKVVLTKNMKHHDDQVKKCEEYAKELSNLRKMLQLQAAPGSSASGSSEDPAAKRVKTGTASAGVVTSSNVVDLVGESVIV